MFHANSNAHIPPKNFKKSTKYERGYLENYQRLRTVISDLDSVALYAVHQRCHQSVVPTIPCGAHNFDARILNFHAR